MYVRDYGRAEWIGWVVVAAAAVVGMIGGWEAAATEALLLRLGVGGSRPRDFVCGLCVVLNEGKIRRTVGQPQQIRQGLAMRMIEETKGASD